MLETLIGFGIWCMAGLFFIALGVYALFSKKAVGFWANAEMFQVTDAKKYNRQCANCFVSWVLFLFSWVSHYYGKKLHYGFSFLVLV